jgi:hypothetical protein
MPHQPVTCVPIAMQDELAKLEKKLRDEHEEKIQQRLNFGRVDLPPRGKIEPLVYDVDEDGRSLITKWRDHKGQICTGRLVEVVKKKK